jgi:hypothetical protein
MNSSEHKKISSLRELPRDIAPPRDLWQGIEAQLQSDLRGRDSGARERRSLWGNRGRLVGAAAVIAALAVGIWIGRHALPFAAGAPATEMSASNVFGPPEAVHATYLMDPRYTHDRAALAKSLEAQLETLPPESRTKVMSSLATIHDSMRDLEAALGRDPSNALLQELLVNTYQDEMRVLTAVHEAGSASKGI